MTPGDLMRAIVPVFPPSESNIVRDGSLRGERFPGELRCSPSQFFMLFDVNNDGLVSFKEWVIACHELYSDMYIFLVISYNLTSFFIANTFFLHRYIFFITLLSIPESSFSVAFKMFDIDNDGYASIATLTLSVVIVLILTYCNCVSCWT